MFRNTTAAIWAAAALALAGCTGTVEVARGPVVGTVPQEARDYDLLTFEALAPDDLTVSEANLYYPIADVVWRGDPYGDRLAQVEALFEEAGDLAVASLEGARPVLATAQITRFHGLTEKAQVMVGGVHSIQFFLTVYDAETGTIIEGPRRVRADLEAWGAGRTLREAREGLSEREKLVDHLHRTLIAELTAPILPEDHEPATESPSS